MIPCPTQTMSTSSSTPSAATSYHRSWRVLRARGILISVAEEPQTPAGSDAIGRYFVVEPNGEQLTRLASLVDQGALRPVISRVLPFVEAKAAFETQKERPSGKIIIQMDTAT